MRVREVPSSIAQKVLAAGELFAERGLDQTKVEDVAEVTGIPKATLYYYFAGKEEILAFLFRDMLMEAADAVAIAIESDGNARERLLAVIEAQLQMMSEQPAVCRALIADLGRAARLPDIGEALTNAFYTPVETLLRDGAADGSLRTVDDPLATSVAIFGAIVISGLSHLVIGAGLPVREVVERLTELLFVGLDPR